MPKIKCRAYLSSLQNFTNGEIPLTEIAKNFIIAGISKQQDEKKLANSISNRIYNDGYFNDEEIRILDRVYKSNEILIPQNDSQNVILDYYPDVFGSCGTGIFELSQEKEQIIVPKKAFFEKFSSHKQYSIINAYGNSMVPLFYDRDKLIVEHWNGEQIIDNKPYIFTYKDEIFIKRLAKNIDQLMIISENKDYDIRKLTGSQLNDINIIGQIVGLIRDLR